MNRVPVEIVRAKVRQAVEVMREHNVPLWIVQYAQETDLHPEPCQDVLIGTSITWPSAFIIQSDGTTTAIVGTGDIVNVESVGAYDRVIGYVQDVAPELRRVIEAANPDVIGISTSADDFTSDCITLGKYQELQRILGETAFAHRLESAEAVLAAVRSRKLPAELDCIQAAVDRTLELFAEVERRLAPGITEREIGEFLHQQMSEQGMESAWDWEYDPVVNFGPDSAAGHAAPGNIRLQPGHLVHIDLGVKLDGYCSDLQRTWYVLRPGETAPPEDVVQGCRALVRSLQAGFEALSVGVAGWEVDAAARQSLVSAGYDEPKFALGHQLGQNAHDGAGLLGPRWARYGRTPEYPIEPSSVFTLEYSVTTSAGSIGIEEDIVVTSDGPRYLAPPQTELRLI